MAHVKWLRSIEVLDAPFDGYQQTIAYRYTPARSEPGEPVTLMRVRSLMVPPGMPDFLSRTRIVERGNVELTGRAWSGRSPIAAVEVSTDGGETWQDAELRRLSEDHPYAWQEWRFAWPASEPGAYELLCRATDANGNVQPLEQAWNARGMGNNMAQRVSVLVR
jgi:sulfane dehydrogenase subunit SoxC